MLPPVARIPDLESRFRSTTVESKQPTRKIHLFHSSVVKHHKGSSGDITIFLCSRISLRGSSLVPPQLYGPNQDPIIEIPLSSFTKLSNKGLIMAVMRRGKALLPALVHLSADLL